MIAGSNNTAIPNTITSIDTKAFSGRSGLASVTIPNSVTSIGKEAFSGCSGLSSIVVDDGNTKYDSRNNCNAIIETESNSLITGCQNTTIPNSVTSISYYAFEGCSSLTSITIPNSVTSIGSHAFEGCSSLTSISIPNSVISIGSYAFNNTGWYNNQSDGLLYLDNWLIGYKGSKPTGKIIIKDGTKKICNLAFEFCSSLTSINIPNSVTSIEGYAFYGCSSLTSINIPNSVTSIGIDAFHGCFFLNNNFINNSSLTSSDTWGATLCDEETSDGLIIKSYSIIYCRQWATTVTIPNSVTSIGNSAFSNCSGLISVKVDISSPLSIDYYTFYRNQANATLYVPEGSKSAYGSANYWKDFKSIVEFGTDISQLDNVIYIDPTECRTSSEFNISIKMKNSAKIRGFQFDLYLPEGVTAVKNAKGRIQGSLSCGRLPEDDAHTLTITEQTDGAIRFLCGSQYDETFTGTDGEIATLTVQVADDMAEGDYHIIMRAMKLTETDISKFYETANITSLLIVSSYIPGDINGDNKVDVSDYIGVANHIMGNTPTGFNVKAADVDGNGIVDVSDYIGIANFIMTGSIYGSSSVKELLYKELEAE